MNLNEVKLLKSVSIWMSEVYFENKKEIVFVWRSNMGKSSLMNSIFWKKDLVKTSSKPWKTRLANIFIVDNKHYFTDLPWYWFAKLWKDLKQDLDWLISWYLEERKESIKKVVILIDSKLWPQEVDIEMYDYILNLWLPITIVLSKVDKLSNSDVKKSLSHAQETFFWQEIIPVSSLKMIWIKDLINSIKKSLS